MDAVQHDMGDGKGVARTQPAGTGQPSRREDTLQASQASLQSRCETHENARASFQRKSKDTKKRRSTENVGMLSADLSRTGRFLLLCYVGIVTAALASAFIVTSMLTPRWYLNQYLYGIHGRQAHCVSAIPQGETPWRAWGTSQTDTQSEETKAIMANSRHLYAEGAVIGTQRTMVLRASVLCLVSFSCVMLAAVIPAVVVIFRPQFVHSEFEECGTLSNLGHDISLPRGRVFTTMLFTASLLSLVSGYTHTYQNWFPKAYRKVNVLYFALQGRFEKMARSAWVTFPNVGLMLTAALPSLTDTEGTNVILTIIHNIAAPSSLLFAWCMEAWQLGYGENAFTYFLCSEANATWFGPLTGAQRFRVIILGYFGVAGTMFLCMQFYLALPFFGVKIKTSYTFALCCFFAEITALILAYGLPLIQGLTLIYMSADAEHMFERAALIESLPPPAISMPRIRLDLPLEALATSHYQSMSGGAGSLLQSNQSHRFLHPLQRVNLAKQLRAGADGQPLF